MQESKPASVDLAASDAQRALRAASEPTSVGSGQHAHGALPPLTDTAMALNQCRAVAHLARALADIHEARISILKNASEGLVEVIGESTAEIMELLGDMLSNMDGIVEDDGWIDPVFEAAHARWPVKASAALPGSAGVLPNDAAPKGNQ